MLEQYLINHCAPTLASLKTASLFTLDCSEAALEGELALWNGRLAPKGVELLVLRREGARALIYVCRKARLRQDLEQPLVARFLREQGYPRTDPEGALATLKGRLAAGSDFPHEIGIFLGYPLGDVIGFIQNGGQNCKCAGCWKVYVNECETIKAFARFKKCREIYRRQWRQGRSVWQLTVAA